MSIFSINDNSSYGSIISQTKANKENKTGSKTNFANTFIKQNASKLVEIQSSNTQTLALNEAISNKNNIKMIPLIIIYQVILKILFIL